MAERGPVLTPEAVSPKLKAVAGKRTCQKQPTVPGHQRSTLAVKQPVRVFVTGTLTDHSVLEEG